MSSETKFTSAGDNDNANPNGQNPIARKDVKQESGTSSSEINDGKYKRGKVTMVQGYNHMGEKDEIGVVLALKSEKFANKVAFTTFIDKMKNHVLTDFKEARDMMPILESLKDPQSDVEGKEPSELTSEEAKSEVKRWMKQEKVKQHIKRLNVLD